MPDEGGKDREPQTRRERNEAAASEGVDVPPSPPLSIPDCGRYIWDWFFAVSDAVGRIRNGACTRVPPTEWVAQLRDVMGVIVRPSEYATLQAMDRAYCAEMNKELADFEARRRAAAEEEAKRGKQ